MSGLEPVVFLAKTAKVMLTMNLWSHVGLCDGATGHYVISFMEIVTNTNKHTCKHLQNVKCFSHLAVENKTF